MGEADEYAGQHLRKQLPQALFMHGVDGGEQGADRHRLHVAIGEARDDGARLRLVQRADDGAIGVDALVDFEDEAPGNQRGMAVAQIGIRDLDFVEARGLAAHAADFEGVGEAPRGQYGGLRRISRQQGVEPHGGAMAEALDARAELFEAEAAIGGGHAQALDHPAQNVAGGGRLEHAHARVFLRDPKIRESAADIRAYEKAHGVFPSGALRAPAQQAVFGDLQAMVDQHAQEAEHH